MCGLFWSDIFASRDLHGEEADGNQQCHQEDQGGRHSPLEFDELVEAWNTLCEQAWTEKSDDFQFADIENAALAALSEGSAVSHDSGL